MTRFCHWSAFVFVDSWFLITHTHRSDSTQSHPSEYVQKILNDTPKPKGRNAFTSIHIVGPHESVRSAEAEETIRTLCEGSEALNKEVFVHRLDAVGCMEGATPMQEYNTIFKALHHPSWWKNADRASLLVFVGWEDVKMDSYAAFIGLLPFRGVQVALITRRKEYGNLLSFTKPYNWKYCHNMEAGEVSWLSTKYYCPTNNSYTSIFYFF